MATIISHIRLEISLIGSSPYIFIYIVWPGLLMMMMMRYFDYVMWGTWHILIPAISDYGAIIIFFINWFRWAPQELHNYLDGAAAHLDCII